MPSRRFASLPLALVALVPALPAPAPAGSAETTDSWNGFVRRHFTVAGCPAWVVEPKAPRPGNPWSWCMEFPDAFTERCAAPALLEKGFHHAHIAVGNTFGCPAALERFTAFYSTMRARGLGPKAVLIGLSRGGLYAYRWAAANPDKVGAIYGDAPVCDFKSWPGGKGKGKGSAGDWAELIRCYGFRDEAEALAWPGNPVDVLAPLARARIPIVHVVGDADDVVPAEENTAVLEDRYRRAGGEILVIHKPGVGHHPHGLDDPSPVVKYIIDHAAVPAPATATVTVTAGKARPYSRLLFGGFIEHFHRQVYGGIFEPGSPRSDAKGFRTDVIAAVRELRTPIVRWPGGCFVSAYHWKDGVGPERRPAFDKAWGVEDPNAFGTDEFVEWCRLAGPEPYICGNAGTGTPEEMSDWVEYANGDKGKWARLRAANGHPRPYGVKYWSIGNENYGDWEIGAKTAGEWGLFVREASKMMRRADPAIVLLAAALPDEAWTRNLLDVGGSRLDMVSIHGYYDPLWGVDAPSDYLSCVLRSADPEGQIAATERIIEADGAKGRIAIAFDEWNLRGWHHPGVGGGFTPEQIAARDRNDRNATYTMADAVFSACFLNICLRHAAAVKMANIAPLVNARGPLYVHPKGIVKRTTFHAMAMYANLLGERVARAEVAGPPLSGGGRTLPAVDAVATCDAARKDWRIALVNRGPSEAVTARIVFGDAPATGAWRATTLAGDGPDAFNDVDRPDRVVPVKSAGSFRDGAVSLPPHSVTVLEVDGVSATSAAPAPLVANGGFETGEGGRPGDWTATRWGDGAYRAAWSEDRPHAGRRCVSLESAGGADCAWTQDIEVEPGARYRLSGWIRTEGVAAGTGRGALLNVQEIQGPTARVLTGTNGWTRVEMEFDAGGRESVQVNCLLGGWGRSTGRAWFDDIAVERVGP